MPGWDEARLGCLEGIALPLAAPTLESLGIDRMSVVERVTWVQAIWDSIAPEAEATELTDAQKGEVDRRLEAIATIQVRRSRGNELKPANLSSRYMSEPCSNSNRAACRSVMRSTLNRRPVISNARTETSTPSRHSHF